MGQRGPRSDTLLDLGDLLTAPYDAVNWVADQLFLFMHALYGRFGIPIVFAAALAEATIGLGVVFPGVLLMFLAGAYAQLDPGNLALVWSAAVAGTLLGDTISYGLGRWGSRLVATSPRFGPALRLGRALVTGRTKWVIPFYHLHSISRAVGPFGAGAVRMPLRVWMPLDYAGAIIANSIWVGGGAILGTAVLTPEGTLEQHPVLRVGLGVAAVAWFVIMQKAVARRMAELSEAESDHEDLDGPEAGSPAEQPEPALGR